MQARQDFRLGGGFARSIAESDFIASDTGGSARMVLQPYNLAVCSEPLLWAEMQWLPNPLASLVWALVNIT